MIEKKIKNIYISSFGNVDERVRYLLLVGTKIISNNLDRRSIEINERRMIDEFVYLKYYSGNDEYYFLCFFLPIILSFRSFTNYLDIAIDLTNKLSRFFGCEKKKNQYLLDVFCYDYLIRNYLIKNEIEIEDTIENLKNEVIDFNPFAGDKKRNVEFQIEKIKYINAMHKTLEIYRYGDDLELHDLTGIIILDAFLDVYFETFDYDKGTTIGEFKTIDEYEEKINSAKFNFEEKKRILKEDVGIKSVRNSFRVFFDNTESKSESNLINSMSEYLLKVRNFDIQTKSYTVKSNPRYLVEINVGEIISDPILNNIKVISKNISNGYYIIEVISKTGKYVFAFRK